MRLTTNQHGSSKLEQPRVHTVTPIHRTVYLVCLFTFQEMKKELPLLSHCVVIGDDRKYLTMLVSLKCEVKITRLRQGRGVVRQVL